MTQSQFLPDEDPSYIEPAGVCFIATLLRSLGLDDTAAAPVLNTGALEQGFGLMGRDPVPAALIAHLQPVMNSLAYHAHHAMDGKGIDDTRTPTALTLARWVLWQAPYCDDAQAVQELINEASDALERAVLDYDFIETLEGIAQEIPGDVGTQVIDPGTVQSLLARFCGLSRSKVMAWGVGRSQAGYMLNGREDWPERFAEHLAQEVYDFGQTLADMQLALYDDDADLPVDAIARIRSLNQAQTAAMWLQWPMYRPFLERYSQHVFSSDRQVGRRTHPERKEA